MRSYSVITVDIPAEIIEEGDRLTVEGYEIPLELIPLFSGAKDGDEIIINVTFWGSFIPGCHYLPNGDPGYPDEYDEGSETNFIEIGDETISIKHPLFIPLDNFLFDTIIDGYEVDWGKL